MFSTLRWRPDWVLDIECLTSFTARQISSCLGVLCALIALLTGCGGGSYAVEPPESNPRETAIRTYLASEFLYESWYPSVGAVDVRRRIARVSTSLGDADRGPAAAVCSAVLKSGEVKKVVVGFGAKRAYRCP